MRLWNSQKGRSRLRKGRFPTSLFPRGILKASRRRNQRNRRSKGKCKRRMRCWGSIYVVRMMGVSTREMRGCRCPGTTTIFMRNMGTIIRQVDGCRHLRERKGLSIIGKRRISSGHPSPRIASRNHRNRRNRRVKRKSRVLVRNNFFLF